MATARRQAPDFPGGIDWFNVDRPPDLAELRGGPILLDFTLDSTDSSKQYLDELNRLSDRFGNELVIICVHHPLLPAARRRSHMTNLISRRAIRYPVMQDSDGLCCALFGVHERTARVLLDCGGYIVGSSHGTGKLPQLERVIAHELETGGSDRAMTWGLRRSETTSQQHVLRFPTRLIAARDRIFVADSGNHRILMLSRQGAILREYGGGGAGFIDGEGGSAAFDNPQGMCRSDGFLYVADTGNHAIRRINLRTDEVDTIAGTGRAGGQDLAMLSRPRDCTLHSPCDVLLKGGRLYIAMSGVHQVWRLSLVDNTLGILAGSGEAVSRDGVAHQAGFLQPVALAWCNDRCYCVDASGCSLRSIDPASGRVSTVPACGDGKVAGRTNGTGDMCLQYPFDVECDAGRNRLWLADSWNNRIRAVDIRGGLARSVSGRRLDEPCGLALDGNTLYIANTNAHELLRVDIETGRAETLNVVEEYNTV